VITADTFRVRLWASALLAIAVGSLGVWQAYKPSFLDAHASHGEQALMAVVVAVAVGCYRLLPSLGLAVIWLASTLQVALGIDIAVIQLAVVFVAYGAARYGQVVTVWLSGLSIPIGSAIGLWYLHSHGIYSLEAFGLAISPARQPTRITALLVAFIVLAGPWALGLLLRVAAQTRLAREERERAMADAARAQEVAALRAEQNRLARDVHDVVGHSLAVILAQADSAQYMDDNELERIRTALANISISARRSLGEVRDVLSTSGSSEGRAARQAGSLDGLIEGVRSAGYEVDSDVVGAARPLPPELDAVAFRVLQEMLTNALKHGSRDCGGIAVRREWGELDLRIEVRNPVASEVTAGWGEGLGLIGMRRRLEAVGGRLSAGPSAAAGPSTFTATAWMPIRDRGGAS
jgi:signal transduction histidine kinase